MLKAFSHVILVLWLTSHCTHSHRVRRFANFPCWHHLTLRAIAACSLALCTVLAHAVAWPSVSFHTVPIFAFTWRPVSVRVYPFYFGLIVYTFLIFALRLFLSVLRVHIYFSFSMSYFSFCRDIFFVCSFYCFVSRPELFCITFRRIFCVVCTFCRNDFFVCTFYGALFGLDLLCITFCCYICVICTFLRTAWSGNLSSLPLLPVSIMPCMVIGVGTNVTRSI